MYGRALHTPAWSIDEIRCHSSLCRPEKAARRLLDYAKAFEPVQDGRIYIEKINGPFLFGDKGTPAEYAAGPNRAISLGWLQLHESATFVKQRGAVPTCCLKAAEDWMALARTAEDGWRIFRLGDSWQNSHRRNRRSQGQLMQAPVTQLARLNAGASLTPPWQPPWLGSFHCRPDTCVGTKVQRLALSPRSVRRVP
jgi:hypothetical protein